MYTCVALTEIVKHFVMCNVFCYTNKHRRKGLGSRKQHYFSNISNNAPKGTNSPEVQFYSN